MNDGSRGMLGMFVGVVIVVLLGLYFFGGGTRMSGGSTANVAVEAPTPAPSR